MTRLVVFIIVCVSMLSLATTVGAGVRIYLLFVLFWKRSEKM